MPAYEHVNRGAGAANRGIQADNQLPGHVNLADGSVTQPATHHGTPHATGLYALAATDIDGRLRQLSDFAGNVTLVVNVASNCGFTDSNYKGLQPLYDKYHKLGLEILAFPCNQFGAQEPGTPVEVKQFATEKYHVTFAMFSKVDVNGPHTDPVFKYLKQLLPAQQGGGGSSGAGQDFEWNFQKVLVNRQGMPVKMYHQQWDQEVIERDVAQLLQIPATS
eukprot:GHRR01036855.1.p1 GENE.GHRR01036855.1~~GHRR01036855.1.p1  ORF type:complete len:220 (+),score=57.95 GHRR01036855.1:729-1388(+)